MTEALIESAAKAKIAAALDGCGLERVKVQGAWDVLAEGEVKGREEPQFDVFAAVAVSPRSYEAFSTPVANFAASVSISVRADRDPTGAKFRDAADAVLELLQTWQREIATVREDFTVEGFTPHGARMDGGEISGGPDAGAWTLAATFTVRGVISQASGGSNSAGSVPDAEASDPPISEPNN